MTERAAPHPEWLIVVGASAGGVEALRELVAHLPSDLAACVCVVLHLPPNAASALPIILDRAGPLPAVPAEPELRLTRGTVIVGVPDHHLLVGRTRATLSHGPRENGYRPAVDVLFRSAARWWGAGAIAVVLSGSLDDGAAGAFAISAAGGQVLVQEPDSAAYPAMPSAALAVVPEARKAEPAKLAGLLAELCSQAKPASSAPADPTLILESEMAELDEGAHAEPNRPGRPAGIACPECQGAMFELDEGGLVRYRCRVGHAWSPETLLTHQVAAAESALWTAIRTLEEKGAVHRRMAAGDGESMRAIHQQQAADAEASAAVIRGMLRDLNPVDRSAG